MRTFIAALALGLTACAPDGAAPPSTVLWDTSWIAETIAGKAVAPPGAITLTFGDGSVNGNGGCNSYSGEVAIKGDHIKFGNVASTLMACIEGGRMAQEGAFHEVLRAVVRFERPKPDQLDLIAADGRRIAFVAKR